MKPDLHSKIKIKTGFEKRSDFVLDERRVDAFLEGRLKSITLIDNQGFEIEKYEGNDLIYIMKQVALKQARRAGNFKYWHVRRKSPTAISLAFSEALRKLGIIDDSEFDQFFEDCTEKFDF